MWEDSPLWAIPFPRVGACVRVKKVGKVKSMHSLSALDYGWSVSSYFRFLMLGMVWGCKERDHHFS